MVKVWPKADRARLVAPDVSDNSPAMHWQGEIIDPQNIDQLIDVYERAKRAADEAYAVQRWIREQAACLTHGTAKTRRLVGKRRQAKITMPDDAWEQSQLKEAWNSFPQYRDNVLGIAALRVKLREFKKLANSSGDSSFNLFRDMVVASCRGPQGIPTLTIED